MARSANRNRNRSEATANTAPAPVAVPAARSRAAPDPELASVEDHEHDRPTTAATARAASSASQTASASGASTGSTAMAPIEQRALGGVNARNAFEAYGQQMSISSITGTLIKFNKGDWVTGEDEDLDEGMELVANMDQLMVGWIKWVDNRPAEQIMGPVAEGYQAPRRGELGDLDQNNWEVDDNGRARDPWQFSNYIVMKEPGQDASTDNLYTFATSSKGGLGCIGALCREYGKQMRVRPDEFPIVKLGADSYKHPEYGRTHVPLLEIVGWEPKAQFEEVAEVSTREPEPEPEPAPRAAAGGRRRR